MANALIVFDSWYGNTRLVAEEIARGISSTGRVMTTVASVQELSPPRLRDYDIIVIGSASHLGAATRPVKNLLHQLAQDRLDTKTVSFFDTHLARQTGGAVLRMKKALNREDPSLHIASPGISVFVDGVRGPIHEGEQSRCREFGARLAGIALA
ncbi:MAG: flavodoxin family protein [Thermoplasmata archaeon]